MFCLQEDGHIVPGRFQQVVGFHDYSVQQQHPCYTTSSRDLGKKKPQVIHFYGLHAIMLMLLKLVPRLWICHCAGMEQQGILQRSSR
jgi:hypothetical protein